MSKCKREGCESDALLYPSYRGFCSHYCMDMVDEYESGVEAEWTRIVAIITDTPVAEGQCNVNEYTARYYRAELLRRIGEKP